MKRFKSLFIASLLTGFLGVGVITFAHSQETNEIVEEAQSYYTPSTHYDVCKTQSDFNTYYSSASGKSGDQLLSALRSINSSNRHKTMGYSSMGTSISTSSYIYTDYALGSTTTDSNGQVYGTQVASFYTKTSSTGWNREHVWPDSRGGNQVEGDILHTRPTISSENSSRGNSFYVEGMNHSSNGWDPYTAGYDIACRGECARIILYSVVASSNLSLVASNTGSGNVMGNMNTLIKWHFDYSPSVYEMNRNNGAQYLQGNRNPFVDHPEYVALIWSNFNSTVKSLCDEHSSMYDNWTPGNYSSYGTNDGVDDTSPSVSLNKTALSLTVDEQSQLTASIKNGSGTISWTSSNTSVATVDSTGLVTAVADGTCSITASVTISGKAYSKSCTVTVSSSGSVDPDEPGEEGDSETIDLTSKGYSDGTSVTTVSGTSSNLTVTFAQGTGSNAPKYYSTGTAVRCYPNNTLTITSSNRNIVKVVFTFGSGDKSNPITVSTGSFSTDTWTGNSKNITFTIGGSKDHRRISTIEVTYEAEASTKTLTSIEATNITDTYTVGDAFVKPTITAYYDDESSKVVTSSAEFSGYNMSVANDYTVTVSYTEGGVTKYDEFDITVNPAPTLTSLSVSGTLSKSSYYAGDTFDPTGLTVTAHYSDSSSSTVTSNVTWTPNPLTTGLTSVTGTYLGETVVVNGITVQAIALSSITTSGQKVNYSVGDTFSYDGTCTAHYNNGSSQTVTPTVNSSAVNMSKEGNYEVTLSYTEGGVTKTTSYSISVTEVPFVNSIEACYSLADEAAISNVYGLYVGTGDGRSPILMNGEYGIVLYASSFDFSSWKINETYIKISSGNLDIYNNVLYEIKNFTSHYEIVTNTTEIQQNVAPVSIYDVTGNESSSNLTVASRLCLLTGTITSTTKDSKPAAGTEYGATMNVEGHSVNLYVKSSLATAELATAIFDAKTSGDEITLKGYTTFYKSSGNTIFQIYIKEAVEVVEDYLVEDFAQVLLNLTDPICSASTDKANDLGAVWLTLQTTEWTKLAQSEKEKFTNGDPDQSGNVLARAIARYERVVSLYANLSDFANRNVVRIASRTVTSIEGDTSSYITLLVSISVISLLGLTTLLVIKKKKHQ